MFYLPLSSDQADRLASEPEPCEFLATASLLQAAALLFVQNLPRQPTTASADAQERRFAEIVRIAQALESAAPGRFQEQVAQRFDREALAMGLGMLGENGIGLLTAEVEYPVDELLDDEGQWNFLFADSYRQRVTPLHAAYVPALASDLLLSDQQNRLLREFLSGIDESVAVQGFAGTGKTFLIHQFARLLDPQRTLLLALTEGQLRALQARVKDAAAYTAMTFGQLADDILNRDLTSNGWRLRDPYRTKLSWRPQDAQVVKWLGITDVGPLQARDVVGLCIKAVRNFCRSGDSQVQLHHLPWAGLGTTPLDQEVLLEKARLYWQELIRPSAREIQLPVRDYHRVKLLSLTSQVIDSRYTHVIVDEAHELSAPMLAVLDRSPQAVIALGDELQNLNGLSPHHGGFIRQRYIDHSLRAGPAMDGVLNPLIQAHPASIQAAFSGSAEHYTRVSFFDTVTVPEQPTALIVDDEWGLFGWFQRLTHQGVPFVLLHSARKDFELFVEDCIELYRYGTRPRHPMLFRYASWQALEQDKGDDKAFVAVANMLRKGYTPEHFAKAKSRYRWDKAPKLFLGRVRDVKNMEFARVMVSPELMVAPLAAGNRNERARLLAGLYTACSRARHELIVPGGMLDWVKDQVRG
ncbi:MULTISPECIES: AAA family ATPase [unclassified Pseudomonas]|uniref:AAA family ATPase n=1 Tax=unclassified Pseudomonas TaxID=196821 RepID=UPI0021BB39D9|nr:MULTISPECIES: AAA family ATPase [unclassified Pseudomonas]MCT8163389.1 AAA family ATPase [Pseudomonas sp. HD6422]MCT8182271.1 AAA family ATPase [Pseudomonas sp. HD6421]